MVIHKFIIHVLDKNNDFPILNDFEGKINQEVDKFFKKTIKKVSKDDDLRKAIFNNYNENIVKNCCEQIIYNEETFVENSKEIASYLFEIMKINQEIDSCDLAVCLYSDKDEKNVAILKLDYKKLYTHTIEYVDDKFNIQMVSNKVGISETANQKQCAIVGVSGINDEYHFVLVDKDFEKKGLESKFLSEFLCATKIDDDKYKTKVFKNTTENWITNALSKDMKQAEDVRGMLNYSLKEKNDLEVDKFIKDAINDEDLRDSFKEHLKEKGIEDTFSIDKKWIEKKLKNRSIKTDTGFKIKSNYTNFEDNMKYSIRKNENGTFDILIKNITFYEEK